MAKQTEIPSEIRDFEVKYERAAKARRPHDANWLLDAAFYTGRQYVEWNQARGGLQTVPEVAKYPKRPWPVDNRIYSYIMDSWASASAQEVDVEVRANSSDSTDISNAKVATAALDFWAGSTMANFGLRRDDALFWTTLVGEGWLKWTYNDGAARPDVEFCSPLEVYADPTPTNYLDARWIIHSRGMDPEDVYDRYGVELKADAIDKIDQLGQSVLREIGMATGVPTCTVKEIWELPSRRYPKGRFAVWCRGEFLSQKADGSYGVLDFPYRHGQLPYTQIGHSPVPGTMHYTSGTSVMRPLQMELNQYHGQKITSRKKFANHKWAIDSSAADTMEELPNDDIDQVLIGDFRNGANVPKILQATPWPDSQDGEWLESAMDDAVGLHEASQGGAPGRVDSAQGIQQLQEADESRLSRVKSTLKVAVARGMAQWLELARQYMKEEQIVPYYTVNGAPAVHAFKTSAFPDKPMLRVVIGGGLPKSRTQRQAQITALFTAGLFGPPTDPSAAGKAMRLLDMPTDMDLTGQEIDELEAEQENLLMMQGIPVTPKPWQNHDVHRAIHNTQRKGAEFGSASEEVWRTFQFHMDATDAQELIEVQQEAERQAHIAQVTQAAAASVQPPDGSPAEEAGEPPAEAAAEGDAPQSSPAAPPTAPAPAPTTPQP